jgi:hypothetical protein
MKFVGLDADEPAAGDLIVLRRFPCHMAQAPPFQYV